MLGNGFGPDLGYVVSILVVLGALIGGLIAIIIHIAGRNRPRPLYPPQRPPWPVPAAASLWSVTPSGEVVDAP